jgi:hypothetical protein
MDLQQLHERTRIELRKLRYCLDHHLIPKLHIRPSRREAGKPRRFAEDVGFAIVCAAKLLELGLPHTRIQRFLDGMLQIYLPGPRPEKLALSAIFEQNVSAIVQLGDGKNVRIEVKEYAYDSGWLPPSNRDRLSDEYRPTVIVELDIGRIRDQVFYGQ